MLALLGGATIVVVSRLRVNIRYGLMQRVFSVETDVSKKLYETCGRKFVIWFADVSLPLKSKHV